MNIRLLAEIHNRPKEVKQALDRDGRGRNRTKVSSVFVHLNWQFYQFWKSFNTRGGDHETTHNSI